MEEEQMKNKMIVALSLVTSGVMTYLIFSGLDEGFYHFPRELFASFGMMSYFSEMWKGIRKMTEAIISSFIGISLLVWLVGMLTGWFDQTLIRQFIRGAWGGGFMIFVVFPIGMKWLKGESHDCD